MSDFIFDPRFLTAEDMDSDMKKEIKFKPMKPKIHHRTSLDSTYDERQGKQVIIVTVWGKPLTLDGFLEALHSLEDNDEDDG